MSAIAKRRRLSVQEYLALEADSTAKHEFYRGGIFAMAGAPIPHNVIAMNVAARLHALLRGKNCRPYGSDLRLSIRAVGLYTYPDVMVICGPAERDADDKNAVTNPRVVVEVLSKATENYDRGQKWEFYQKLDSLRSYVLVSQEEAKVTHYSREDSGGPWHYELLNSPEASLALASLDCTLPLAEIYEGVTLGPEEAPAPPLTRPA